MPFIQRQPLTFGLAYTESLRLSKVSQPSPLRSIPVSIGLQSLVRAEAADKPCYLPHVPGEGG